MKHLSIIIAFFACLSCKHTAAQKIPYQLEKPHQHYTLPAILNEVSGITALDSRHSALVQDEEGTIFIFDILSGKVIDQFSFNASGDYEGVTISGRSLFILRSDGQLTEWINFTRSSGGEEIRHYTLPLQTRDNEGLCFDKANNRLLIAAKSKPDAPGDKAARYIYSYDLNTRKLVIDKNYSINTESLGKKAKESGLRNWTVASKGKSKAFNFRPSDLAIHPSSGDLYILSAIDHLLVIIDKQGKIKHILSLDVKVFPKAEGITFLPDGTMLITNEANGKVATVLKYNIGM